MNRVTNVKKKLPMTHKTQNALNKKALRMFLLTTGLAICALGNVFAQGTTSEQGTFKDERDGQVYETVTVTRVLPDPNRTTVSFTWMAQNLNYAMEGSDCYAESEANCETYGRLYTWDAAMQACPKGWRLPNDDDWYLLSFAYGGNCSSGEALKSDSPLWTVATLRGTNRSLFNGLPSGTGGPNGQYFGLGRSAIFWSSTEKDANRAWDWKFIRKSELQRWHGGKGLKNCVRCIKD